jgi:hypothetical protein
MAIVDNYGTLKTEMGLYLFHQRLANRYDSAISQFEAAANTRLRVRQMETKAFLQTDIAGNVRLPEDYLLWRSVLQDNTTTTGGTEAELEYVHPAYLKSTAQIRAPAPGIFTIEGPELIIRPADTAAVYIVHYYGKIPTLVPDLSTGFGDTTNNWLIVEYPNAYIYGVLCELAAMQRNAEMAQLYKTRRDEAFAEIIQLSALTTGATSPRVRTAEYF